MLEQNDLRDGHGPDDWKLAGWTVVAVVLVVAARWMPPLWSSFWLDETVTAWIGTGPWATVTERAREFQFASPYFLISSLSLRLPLAPIELRARLPSLFFMAAALPFVFLLAERLADRVTACFAVLFFSASPWTSFIAADARPYALALLLIVVSAWFHVRWLQGGRLFDGAAAIALAAATVFVHLFAGAFAGAVGVSTLLQWRTRRRAVAVLALLAALMALLYAPTGLRLLGRAESLGWIPLWACVLFLPLVLQSTVPLPLCVAVPLAAIMGKFGVSRWREAGRLGLFFWLWLGLPIGTLLALSFATGVPVLVARYAVALVPAIAIGLASVASRLPRISRLVVFMATVLLAILFGILSREHSNVNWRTLGTRLAAAGASAESVVFFRSGLVEGNNLSFVDDPIRVAYLMAPAQIYPVPGRLSPLPFDASSKVMAVRVRQRLTEAIGAHEPRFFVVGLLTGGPADSITRWFVDAAPSYEARVVDREIMRFERRSVGGLQASPAAHPLGCSDGR